MEIIVKLLIKSTAGPHHMKQWFILQYVICTRNINHVSDFSQIKITFYTILYKQVIVSRVLLQYFIVFTSNTKKINELN